ncbi:MAG: hypothetical protein H6765_00990 [Candidatus Peribacteria bacterium]|nr:MAG: hypothetical protein H6765_00990 [Candidatus Peribacteria bacterium]
MIDLRSNKLFGASYNDLRLSEQPYNEEVAGTQIMLDLYYQVNPAGPRYIGALPQ